MFLNNNGRKPLILSQIARGISSSGNLAGKNLKPLLDSNLIESIEEKKKNYFKITSKGRRVCRKLIEVEKF